MGTSRGWLVAIAIAVGLLLPTPVRAQDPTSFEARAEFLERKMDSGLLPTPMMIAMLQDPYSETRILAVRVVASSSDPSQTMLLREYLRDRDFRVRYEVMIAAGRLGEAGSGLAFKGLGDQIPKVRQAAAWAACHGGPDVLEPLVSYLKNEADVGVRATALANLWRFEDAGWERHAAAASAGSDVQLRRAAAYSLGRSGRVAARPSLRRLAADSEAVIRATAVAGLGRGPLARDDLMVVLRALGDDDPRVRVAACGALARQSSPPLPAAAASSVAGMWSSVEPHLAVMALRAAGSRSEIGTDTALAGLAATEEPWLASEAFVAITRRGADAAQELATQWWKDGERWRRRAVAEVSPLLGEEWEKQAARAEDAAVRLAWLEPLQPEQVETRIEVLQIVVATDPDSMVRTVALNHLSSAGAAGSFDELIALQKEWMADDEPDARAAALIAALAVAETDEQRDLVIENAAEDRNPAVTIQVVNGARSIGLPVRSHERELRHNRAWYVELVDWMLGNHWLDVMTDRGGFRIRLDAVEAPITSREIYDLATEGFYDGLVFHRVVPNFVVQGGDPRGDGWGGAGFILPDEPAFSPFDTGRVGIATGGPNTGGGQLFFTLMPADHLVGHYTNFGEVVAGREVLARLRVGDRIRSITTFSGDELSPPAPVLLGEIEWSELEAVPGWLEEYQAVQPDPASIERLDTATGNYRIGTVLGSWCEDSVREVSRLVRVLDELEYPIFEHRMIGVDRMRRIDDAELAVAIGVERTATRVATIVVFDADGLELGRIVETADRPIEELLVEFIAPFEGWD